PPGPPPATTTAHTTGPASPPPSTPAGHPGSRGVSRCQKSLCVLLGSGSDFLIGVRGPPDPHGTVLPVPGIEDRRPVLPYSVLHRLCGRCRVGCAERLMQIGHRISREVLMANHAMGLFQRGPGAVTDPAMSATMISGPRSELLGVAADGAPSHSPPRCRRRESPPPLRTQRRIRGWGGPP